MGGQTLRRRVGGDLRVVLPGSAEDFLGFRFGESQRCYKEFDAFQVTS